MFLYDEVAAVVRRVGGDVERRRRRVDHRHERHTQVHAQAVDVEEAEERQQREQQPTRRKLCATQPVPFTKARFPLPEFTARVNGPS